MNAYYRGLPLSWWLKLSLVLCGLVFAVLFTVPTFLGEKETWPEWAKSVLPSSRVALGLDLKGGLHLVLEVDLEKSLKESISRSVNRAKDLSAEKGLIAGAVTVESDYSVRVVLDDLTKTQEFVQAVQAQTTLVTFLEEKNNELFFKPVTSRIEEYSDQILNQAVNTIRNRIDQFGVAEPSIVKQGRSRVVVQMPGLQDPARAKELIGNTAQLDFRMVLNEIPAGNLDALLEEGKKALNIPDNETRADLIEQVSQWLRDNEKISRNATIMLNRQIVTQDNGVKVTEAIPYLVQANAKLTGDLIDDAYVVNTNQTSFEPELGVSLNFKPQGAKLFGELTTEAFDAKNAPNQIAIILDQNVHSAPVVNQPITNGQAMITLGRRLVDMDTRMREAQDLALVLKAGALPASVSIIEERQIGPSEGEDNIRTGVYSSFIAAALVVAFMLYIYGTSGLVANIAMIFNVFLILAFLAAFGATLTLPGIAGIVLTMAVAVDGNVIINERIREELRNGASAKAAFYRGYNHSFSTLVDAHVTSAVAGIVLLAYGNPAIKGFAVTLLAGIASTLFTSFYVTEVIGLWLVEKTKVKRFS